MNNPAIYEITEHLSAISNELKKINENLSKPPAERQIINDIIESNLPELTREFLLLALENPTLPIIPIVDNECVGDSAYRGYWVSKIGRSEILEYCVILGDYFFKDELTEKEQDALKERLAKAIFVYITPA